LKTRKLMAVLVMVAMIVTALPVVAFANGSGALGEAVADTSGIFASKEEVEIKEDKDEEGKAAPAEVTITVRLRDENGEPAKVSTDGVKLYVWPERVKDRVSAVDKPEEEVKLFKENDNGKEYNIAVFDDKEDFVDVKFTTTIAGEVKYYFALLDGEADLENIMDEKAGSVTVNFVDKMKHKLIPKITDPIDEDDEVEIVEANGIDAYTVEVKLTDRLGFPVKGKKVLFDTNSSRLILDKDSGTTNSSGIVKVKAYSEWEGEYLLYAKLDSDRKVEITHEKEGKEKKGLPLKFGSSRAYDIKVKKGDGALIALDASYTFEFEVFNIFGRVIKKVDPENYEEYIDEITAPTHPDDAEIEDVDFFNDFYDNGDEDGPITWDKGLLKVTVGAEYLNEEGDYVLRVKLQSGKFAAVRFEVREQGDIVKMTLEYDPAYTHEEIEASKRLKTGEPTIKLFDADGVEKKLADFGDIRFSVSDTLIARINQETGIVEQRTADSEGVVTVTAVNREEKVVATAEVRIGDVGAEGIVFDVPEDLLIEDEHTIKMKVVDEKGNKIMKDAKYDVVVVDEPKDAKVELVHDDGEDKFIIFSDVKGAVKLHVVAYDQKDEENDSGRERAISSTLTLNFVDEVKPAIYGAENVIFMVGSETMFIDGEGEQMDAPAFIEDGRTFVPARYLASAFGVEDDDMTWGPEGETTTWVKLVREDRTIDIEIGELSLKVETEDGEEVIEMDVAAKLVDGRTYLPFRFIGYAFGLEDEDIDWFPKDASPEWVSFTQQ